MYNTSFSSRIAVHSPIIVALDYNNLNSALALVDRIDPHDCQLKVGKEMFTLFGPKIVHELQRRGFEVFLDLKYHDTPNTCARAVSAAAELGVWMIDVHALGGKKMMSAARKALLEFKRETPLLVAVTMLTSMENADLYDFGMTLPLSEHAEKLALLAKNCKLDGIICSAKDAPRLKKTLGSKIKLISPGIRLGGIEKEGHRCTMTPKQALASGVDYIVIGRPITRSIDPIRALKEIKATLLDTEKRSSDILVDLK